jgi:DNA-directed RNA polymerase specialized sigma subunit
MGGNQSKEPIDARDAMNRKHKGPVEVAVERPRLAERAGKPVLNIPNSTYRILYIDPSQRIDVVSRHGYIALRTDGFKPNEEEESEENLEAALPGRRRSTLASRASDEADEEGAARSGQAPDELDVDSQAGDEDDHNHKALDKRSKQRTKAAIALDAGNNDDDENNDNADDQHGGTGVSRRSGTNGKQPMTDTMDRTAKHQQFVYPVGRYAQTKIYFEDQKYIGDYDQEHDGQTAAVYEREEEELYEMGGVPRIVPRAFEPTEADLSYELPSKVLDALRMAIEAPMEAFNVDVGARNEADALADFKSQAMEKLVLMRDPFEDQSTQELIVLAAPIIDHQMTAEEAELRSKNKRRKKLHKDVNQWKEKFEKENGRKATNEELHGDPGFGPMYREYLSLKKELKGFDMPADPFAAAAGAAAPTAAEVTEEQASTSPQTVSVASPLMPAQRPPKHLPAPASVTPQTSHLTPMPGGAVPAMTPQAGMPQARYRSLPVDQRIHVKMMVRKLRRWKQEIMITTGMPATKADIVNDHVVSDDYMELRRLIGADDVDVSDDDIAPAKATPAPEPEQTVPPKQLTLEEQYERRRLLGKQLNEWKTSFADANSRKPTASDIAADPFVQALYEEYISLPKPPEGNATAAAPSADVMAASQWGASTASNPNAYADLSDHELKALGKRKRQLGRELNTWKAKWADEHEGQEPTHDNIMGDAEMAPIYQEYRALQGAKIKDRAESSMFGAFGGSISPQGDGFGGGGDDSAAHKRKKHLGKLLSDWKAKWAEEHEGEMPTHADIEMDGEMGPIYHEYKALSAARRQSKQVTPSRRGSIDPARRKKQLGKELNAWKAAFADTHGRKPTANDIQESPIIAALYEEYMTLKESQADASPDAADTSQGRDGDAASISQDSRAASTQQQETDDSAGMSMRGRKKQLGKELNAWKAKFLEEHGRKPTSDDIAADVQISALYEEYTALKDGGSAAKDGADPGANKRPPSMSDSQGLEHAAAKARKKQLGKELNAWKAKFLEEQGRKPTADDIAADAPVQALYDEYTALKDNTDTVTPSQHISVSQQQENDDAEAVHKRRKKLGKSLNEWKKGFKDANGRAPTQDDINADAQVKAMFDEYQNLPKPTAATGGGDEQQAPGRHDGTDPSPDAGSNNRAARDNAGTVDEDEGAADDQQQQAEVKARKKFLAHQLNQWKAAFTAENDRQPMTQDILADADITPIYEEYLLLAKRI